ncbi:hypothetical protein PYCC9005_001943 [Savitreella phatthalungensis]
MLSPKAHIDDIQAERPEVRGPGTLSTVLAPTGGATVVGYSRPVSASALAAEYHPGVRLDVVELNNGWKERCWRRTSDEIRARQREDLKAALVFGPYDDPATAQRTEKTAYSAYASPRAARFFGLAEGETGDSNDDIDDEDLPQTMGMRARIRGGARAGRLNLPVNRMDTTDMVKFLSEQRAAAHRNISPQVPQESSPASSFSDESTKSTAKSVTKAPAGSDGRRQSSVSKWRGKNPRQFLGLIGIVLLACVAGMIMPIVYGLSHLVAQAQTDGLRINWGQMVLSDLTEASFHIQAVGRFEGTTARRDIILEATTLDMFPESPRTASSFGRLQLGRTQIGSDTDSSVVSIAQTVVVQSRASLVAWATALTSLDFPPVLNLRGKTRMAGMAGMPATTVELRPLTTQLPGGLGSKLSYAPVANTTFMMLARRANTVGFRFATSLTNTGSLGVRNLGRLGLDAYVDDDLVARVVVEYSPFVVGDNTWDVVGELLPPSAGVQAVNHFLTAIVAGRSPRATFDPVHSSIENSTVDYLAALAKGLPLDIALVGVEKPSTSVRFEELRLQSDTGLGRTIEVLAQLRLSAFLGMPVHQELIGLSIKFARLRLASGFIIAGLENSGLGVTLNTTSVPQQLLPTDRQEFGPFAVRMPLNLLDGKGDPQLHETDLSRPAKLRGAMTASFQTPAGIVQLDIPFSHELLLDGTGNMGEGSRETGSAPSQTTGAGDDDEIEIP